jgi:hypothetical protein
MTAQPCYLQPARNGHAVAGVTPHLHLPHGEAPLRLPGGALLHTESLLAASGPERHRYALAHYVSTPCGGAAVPLLWRRTFGGVCTRLEAGSRLWRECAPAVQQAVRALPASPLTLDAAVAQLRGWLRDTGAALLHGRATPPPRGLIVAPLGASV